MLRDASNNPTTAASDITIALVSSNTAVGSMTGTTAIIRAGSSVTVGIDVGTVKAGSTAGVTTISGTASGGFTGTVQSTTVTTTSLGGIVLPAQVLVAPGNTVVFDVTLSSPAPVGGATVNLSVLDGTKATVLASVAFLAGDTVASATMNGLVTGNTTLVASSTNYATTSTAVTVKPLSLTLTPGGTISVPATWSASRQVQLSDAAPTGGVVVTVTIADGTKACIVTVSGCVASTGIPVAQGQLTSSAFQVNGLVAGSTTIAMALSGWTGSTLTLNVQTAPFMNVYGGGLVGPGTWRGDFYVQLAYYTPTDLVVTLTTSNGNITSQATVTILANSYYQYFRVDGVNAGTTATITASATGWTSGTSGAISVATSRELVPSGLDGTRTTLSGADNFTVYLRCNNNGSYCGAPASPIVVNLAVDNPITAIAATPVTIPNTSDNVAAQLQQATAAGTYTLTASTATAAISPGASSLQTVNAPALYVYGGGLLGPGTWRGDFYVQLQNYTPTDLVVTLTTSNGNITSQSTVTILANNYYQYFRADGVNANTTATITASAAGWTSGTSGTITVASSRELFLSGLDGTRTTLSGVDNFTVYLRCNNNGSYCGAPAVAIPVDLAVSNAITTIATTPVTIPNTSDNVAAQLLQASAGGTYTVTASTTTAGIASSVSATQTVNAPLIYVYGGGLVGPGTWRGDFYVQLQNYTPTDLVVTLTTSNGNITAQSSVTVLANNYYQYFRVDGVNAGTTATITASAAGWTSGTSGTISVASSRELVPSGLDGTRTTLSGVDNFNVYLRCNNNGSYCGAPASPIVVNLAVDNPITAIAATPVTIPNTTDNVAAQLLQATAGGTYTLTASTATAGITAGASALQTVNTPAMYIYGGGLLGPGTWRGDFYVQLQNYTPTDLVITLGSTAPGIALPQATVTILANNYYAYFRVDGVAGGSTTITASNPAWTSASAPVTVSTSRQLVLSGLDGTRTTLSGVDNFNVYLRCNGDGSYCGAPAAAIPVDLTVSNAVTSLAAASVTIPNTSDNVAAQLQQAATTGTYTVSASTATAGISGTTSGTQTVNLPALYIYGGGLVGPGTYRGDFYVQLQNYTPTDLVVTLTTSNGNITSQSTVTILANNYYQYFRVDGVNAGTTATITATAPNWISVTSPTINVASSRQLYLSGVDTTRTVTGGSVDNFNVYLRCNNDGSYCGAPAVAIPVDLSVTNAITAPVATPVTIPTSSDYVAAQLTVASGTGTYTLTASTTTVGISSSTSGTVTVNP